jgi:peptide/nickel transport system permease protein
MSDQVGVTAASHEVGVPPETADTVDEAGTVLTGEAYPTPPAISPLRLAARKFRRHRLAVAGLVFVGILVLLAVLAPLISPHDPNAANAAATRNPPSAAHWLGTDSVGRDVLSRLLYGARVSLTVAFAATLSSVGLGTALGLLAGLLGGWVDMVIMRLVDVFLSFPGLVVLILLVAILGPGMATIILVITVFGWPGECRLVRQLTLSIKEMDFVLAARATGSRSLRIMYRHVLPHVLPPLTVVVALTAGEMILLETALSFLGLGVTQPQASWGSMLQDAQSLTVLQQMPWLWIPPGLGIVMTVLAINFIGDGLRDALDPRQQL